MRVEKEYFFCYSSKTMGQLKAMGHSYICCALHERTGRRFWLFKRTDALTATLDDIHS